MISVSSETTYSACLVLCVIAGNVVFDLRIGYAKQLLVMLIFL